MKLSKPVIIAGLVLLVLVVIASAIVAGLVFGGVVNIGGKNQEEEEEPLPLDVGRILDVDNPGTLPLTLSISVEGDDVPDTMFYKFSNVVEEVFEDDGEWTETELSPREQRNPDAEEVLMLDAVLEEAIDSPVILLVSDGEQVFSRFVTELLYPEEQ
nr:hypothetical protein TetV2_00040 [Oceanusvirus sp.]